jgi:hypothetical protein
MPSCAAQQSPAVSHVQLMAHSLAASLTQSSSQTSVQHAGSVPHTQSWHCVSLHPSSSCVLQQLTAPSHAQSVTHSFFDSSTQS